MRRIAAAGLSTALAIGLVTWTAPVAQACSIAVDPDLSAAQLEQRHLDRADLVFEGEATRMEAEAGGQLLAWTFAVDRTIKGPQAATQRVRTASSGAACGVDFREGRRYRVYAEVDGGTATTGLGSGTRELTESGTDSAPGPAPVPTPRPGRPTFTG